MNKKKLITFLLALTMILSLSVGASAAETMVENMHMSLSSILLEIFQMKIRGWRFIII